MYDARQSLIAGAQWVGGRRVFHQTSKVKRPRKKKPFSELDTTLTHSVAFQAQLYCWACLRQSFFPSFIHFSSHKPSSQMSTTSSICNKFDKKVCAASFLNMTHWINNFERSTYMSAKLWAESAKWTGECHYAPKEQNSWEINFGSLFSGIRRTPSQKRC